jgi:hypothetical protein
MDLDAWERIGRVWRSTIVVRRVKTIEEIVFGPRTLPRTWGTRPFLTGFVSGVEGSGTATAFPREKRARYPDFLYATPASAECAAFIRESRMKFVDPITIYRKSGVWGTLWSVIWTEVLRDLGLDPLPCCQDKRPGWFLVSTFWPAVGTRLLGRVVGWGVGLPFYFVYAGFCGVGCLVVASLSSFDCLVIAGLGSVDGLVVAGFCC